MSGLTAITQQWHAVKIKKGHASKPEIQTLGDLESIWIGRCGRAIKDKNLKKYIKSDLFTPKSKVNMYSLVVECDNFHLKVLVTSQKNPGKVRPVSNNQAQPLKLYDIKKRDFIKYKGDFGRTWAQTQKDNKDALPTLREVFDGVKENLV